MGILGTLVIAFIMLMLFSPYKKRASVGPLVVFFLILFFAGYAAQFWIVPFGPVMWGVSWFPVLFVVLIFALLFSAPPVHRRRTETVSPETEQAEAVVGVFIWILFLVLAGAIILGLYQPHAF